MGYIGFINTYKSVLLLRKNHQSNLSPIKTGPYLATKGFQVLMLFNEGIFAGIELKIIISRRDKLLNAGFTLPGFDLSFSFIGLIFRSIMFFIYNLPVICFACISFMIGDVTT